MVTPAPSDSPHTYKHPPIVEAVVEIRFLHAVSHDRIEAAAHRIKASYEFLDPENTVDFVIDAEKQKASVASQPSGFRLASPNRDELVILRENSFICAKLAPYGGWETLERRTRRDWDLWKKSVGPARISRVGLRYINRLDVPINEATTVGIEDYFTVFPRVPEGFFASTSNYAMQISVNVKDCPFGLTINSGSVPSPLIGHVSFGLDLDLFCESDLPQRDDEMWALLSEMRKVKNLAFENCITRKSRELLK